MAQAFGDTCTGDTRLVFAVDDDDPEGHEYIRHAVESGSRTLAGVRFDAAGTMVQALNKAAVAVVDGAVQPFAIAFMGDDHRPRTVGWDTAYLAALRRLGSGMVYGNDLVRGEYLPTQVAMTADIVRTLGWMAPPVLRHMYVDNFWRDLGIHAGCIRYLDDVVVEHLHPIAGTAELDAGYERVNADEMYSADESAYLKFCADGGFRAAVDAVRALQPDPKFARLVGMARASLVAEAAYITGAHTVADIAEQPTDLAYLLGEALQVRSQADPLAADVVCVTGVQEATPALRLAGAAAVTAGIPPTHLAAAGFALLRTRTIGEYTVALGVRR
jgi:hypothetical protein